MRVGGKPDVDRQNPELLYQLQDALLGRGRKRNDQHVDARQAGKLHQFGKSAKLWITCHHIRRALIAAIIENATDADVVVSLLFQCAHQILGGLATTDDYGAALHDAVSRPVANAKCNQVAQDRKRDDATEKPAEND